MNLEKLYAAAYAERYGGDLDALKTEAFHFVPPAGDPMRRSIGEPLPPITDVQARRNYRDLEDALNHTIYEPEEGAA